MTEQKTHLIDTTKDGNKPVVALVGSDGNAFAIIGRVKQAWRDNPEIAKEYTDRALACHSYDDLLMLTMDYINEGEQEEE